MTEEKYFVGELINLETDLYIKTENLFKLLSSVSVRKIKLIELHLSEIYSLRNKLDLFIILKPDLQHYELTSLISFWDKTFYEMKKLTEDDDSNTSWMHSRFKNYESQHKTVDQMFRNYYDSLKD
ncbi:hypothetical protein VD173_001731 [Enterococcus faecium]|uniref:hypothetical protein n=1 Tax=Enterococcus TaxID=1350 RepID=UPI001571EDEE|nr:MULTISPECIES: hypothetical protein [Enterococcus]EGP4927259.1 hypothetical protein [Enterococcus faecium]EGP5054839.1 hypothetical protein [Enterococcus faecium]EGP5143234.1 hypothetical protein [Enterococcus faecium]EME3483476.1 hypothetical protein [Enterococcus faecium]EME5381414.1 hypothetical protein [Enterococcus faecium]